MYMSFSMIIQALVFILFMILNLFNGMIVVEFIYVNIHTYKHTVNACSMLVHLYNNVTKWYIKVIHLAYRMLVVLLRCPLVPEIMQGEAPKVLLPQ